MGRITSNIGLITGIPIQDTIDQLLQIEARPRNLVQSRNKTLQAQQVAFTELTSKLLTTQFHVKKLAKADLFNQQKVTSTNPDLLGGRFTQGEPVEGEFQFTPIRQAQAQRLLSTTFAADDKPLGAGSFSFRYGAAVDEGIDLGLLGGGVGLEQGKIRITDRSGASAEVDLRFARTVDDVLRAVNQNSSINVTLLADGDRFRLMDDTGQSAANLRVQEVGGGRTAANLGLAGIDGTVAADSIAGEDVVRLFDNLALTQLNDRLGVRVLDELNDLRVEFRDGSSPLLIDFNRPEKEATASSGTTQGVNGETAELKFTATRPGGELDGIEVRFVDDAAVTAGNEVVEYDPEGGTLTFRIDEGATGADHIIAALAADEAASADFVAKKTAGTLFATATTSASSGITAEVKLKAKSGGPEFDGFNVSFVDDPTVTQGNETVQYDRNNKTIVFRIDEGSTTAFDVAAAAATNPQLSDDFVVFTPDHFAQATTTAAGGVEAQVKFKAVNSGAEFDGVNIVFEDDPEVTAGGEVVELIDEGGNKTLKIKIEAGATTAADVVAAVNAAGSEASFSASLVEGSSGTGLIDVSDTAVTAGGGNDGLISTADTATTAGGTAGLISSDDRALTDGGAAQTARTELTLGDVIETINERGAGRLQAKIADDGKRIVLEDLTEDRGGEFRVSGAFGSPALKALGLDVDADGGTITGRRLVAGLKSTLLRSLDGGSGLELGILEINDRAGSVASIDLSGAETLHEVVDTIAAGAAAAGAAIDVEINSSRDGLVLRDRSQGSGNLTVSSGSLETAEKLGLAVDDAVSEVRGGDLHRQTVTRDTLLKDLNGGGGVAAGQFQIVNSAGTVLKVTIPSSDEFTVGDVIDSINGPAFNVEAQINATGDGIELIDVAGGNGSLRVVQLGTATTARDLHLLRSAEEKEIGGETRQVIDGSSKLTVELDGDDTLDDLIEKFNVQGGGAAAVKLGDGTVGNPFRISIFGERTGSRANLIFDTSGVDFALNQTARAQDALLEFGGDSVGSGGGVVVASEDNLFDGVLPGVQLEVRGPSATPITIAVQPTDDNIVSTVTSFVESYNALKDVLKELTFFNETDQSTGILFGSSEVLRLETDLANVLTGRFFGVGDFQSLEEFGLSLSGETGKLSFDKVKLQEAFEADPEAVREFFTAEDRGAAVKLDRVIETLVAEDNSLLVNRARTLASKIESNNERIEFFNERLEAERRRLELQFTRMEVAIGKIQNNLTALDSLQIIPPGSFTLGRE